MRRRRRGIHGCGCAQVSGQWTFKTEKIKVLVLLRANKVRTPEAHEPEFHTRDLALEFLEHG